MEDLRNVVCMIIKDGETYRFSHRSFQAYFAAYYTAHLSDEQQKQLFVQILLGPDLYLEKKDYYILLMQIESDRFAENALESKLRALHKDAATAPNPDEFLLQSAFSDVDIRVSSIDGHCVADRPISFCVPLQKGRCYNFNVLELFTKYAKSAFSELDLTVFHANIEIVKDYASRMMSPQRQNDNVFAFGLNFKTVDNSDCITDNERHHLYNALIHCRWGNGIYVLISEWLDKLDAKRTSLKSPSFIDDL